nr:hypothetical transcript [Hymenolepis microstoma]
MFAGLDGFDADLHSREEYCYRRNHWLGSAVVATADAVSSVCGGGGGGGGNAGVGGHGTLLNLTQHTALLKYTGGCIPLSTSTNTISTASSLIVQHISSSSASEGTNLCISLINAINHIGGTKKWAHSACPLHNLTHSTHASSINHVTSNSLTLSPPLPTSLADTRTVIDAVASLLSTTLKFKTHNTHCHAHQHRHYHHHHHHRKQS